MSAPIAAEQPGSFSITMKPQYQPCLELIGVGSAGQVYKVDDHIVLKSSRVFEPLESSASKRDAWFYASKSIFHFNLMRNEQSVYRLLETRPHPKVAEIINPGYIEGIYLRKYLSLPELGTVTQPTRLLWYQDILRGLLHLHNLGIAHSDLRIDNVLLDGQGQAVLCDFSASRPFNQLNPSYPHPDLPVPINGLAESVSDATDRFAMASLIFLLEMGIAAKLSVADNGALLLPEIYTGRDGIGSLIKKAWLGEFASTTDMLRHAESLQIDERGGVLASKSPPNAILQDRARQWRADREAKHGCVLAALPTESQLKELADHYSWDMNGDNYFRYFQVTSEHTGVL